jgi:hypothetical protein
MLLTRSWHLWSMACLIVLFMKVFGNLILTAANVAKAEYPRVAIFGECVHLLWAGGNAEAAIQMEKLGNQLVKQYDVDILCGYSLTGVQRGRTNTSSNESVQSTPLCISSDAAGKVLFSPSRPLGILL